MAREGLAAPALRGFWVPGPDDWWLLGFYGALGLAAAFPRWRPPRRWCLALLAGWISLGFTVHWLRTEHGQLQCTFLSVGHGEAIVVELPSGQTLLYDAGQMAAPTTATRVVSNYLWSRGRTHIDAVVLSTATWTTTTACPRSTKYQIYYNAILS